MRRDALVVTMSVLGAVAALALAAALQLVSAAPAGAQIFETTTTTSSPPSSTTSTLLPTSTTRSTTTTTSGSTTTRDGSTSSSSSSTTRSSTTTTIDPRDTTTTFTILQGPTTAPDAPAPSKNPGGTAEMHPLFPVLSGIGFAVALGLMGAQWMRTRDPQE